MRLHRILLCLSAAAALVVPTTAARAQFQSTYEKAVDALNNGRYPQADTLAHEMLAMGALLTNDQRIKALMVATAAIYTEDKGKLPDSAIVLIKKVIAMGAQKMEPDVTWKDLDDLFKTVIANSVPGKITLASRLTGAVLFVGDPGQSQGPLTKFRSIPIPPGVPTLISIRVEGCGKWDTTVVVRARDSMFVGYRGPTCKP